jgi:hypothetical protein
MLDHTSFLCVCLAFLKHAFSKKLELEHKVGKVGKNRKRENSTFSSVPPFLAHLADAPRPANPPPPAQPRFLPTRGPTTSPARPSHPLPCAAQLGAPRSRLTSRQECASGFTASAWWARVHPPPPLSPAPLLPFSLPHRLTRSLSSTSPSRTEPPLPTPRSRPSAPLSPPVVSSPSPPPSTSLSFPFLVAPGAAPTCHSRSSPGVLAARGHGVRAGLACSAWVPLARAWSSVVRPADMVPVARGLARVRPSPLASHGSAKAPGLARPSSLCAAACPRPTSTLVACLLAAACTRVASSPRRGPARHAMLQRSPAHAQCPRRGLA